MKYALLIVETQSYDEKAILRDLALSTVDGRLQVRKEAMLNASAYLLNLEHGLAELCALVAEARDRKLRTRTLFFDQEPQFVITSP